MNSARHQGTSSIQNIQSRFYKLTTDTEYQIFKISFKITPKIFKK